MLFINREGDNKGKKNNRKNGRIGTRKYRYSKKLNYY